MSSTTLDDLAATALLGTARRPIDLTGISGPAADVVRALRTADDAARLLDAAAVLSAAGRGGVRPQRATTAPPAPAPADTARRVPPAAAFRVAGLLGRREDIPLLLEWLAAAAAGDWVVDPAVLPALLDAASNPAVASAARPVLGERGRWLAAFRPEWNALATETSPAIDLGVWAHGNALQRRVLLSALRRSDPDAGLAMLAETWEQETPDDRADFLRLLESDLRAADEPFLEAALDDRRQQVRLVAATLLGRMPASRFATRMTERALAAIRVERKLMRTRLAVAPPQGHDAAWARDGITVKPPQSWRGGPGAWWLRQIVAATPLGVWSDLLGGEPASVLTTPVLDDWRDPLLEAWCDACQAQQDASWAAALLQHGPQERTVDLIGIAPAAVAEKSLVDGFRARRTPADDHVLNAALDNLPRPWGERLTAAALDWLVNPGSLPHEWNTRERLRILSLALAPTVGPRVANVASHHQEDWHAAIAGLADRLTFRHQMWEELR